MTHNFDYIRTTAGLNHLWQYCNEAEINQLSDPAKSALNGRMALEWMVQAIYYLKGFDKPEHASLFELVSNQQFTNYIGSDDLMRRPHVDLLDEEILDSLVFIQLIGALEDEFGVEVQPTQVPPDTWRSVAGIAALVERQLAEGNEKAGMESQI